MRWLLIEVIDREIHTYFFTNLSEAQNFMDKQFSYFSEKCNDCCMNNYDAWVTDGVGNSEDCDWKIVQLGD